MRRPPEEQGRGVERGVCVCGWVVLVLSLSLLAQSYSPTLAAFDSQPTSYVTSTR